MGRDCLTGPPGGNMAQSQAKLSSIILLLLACHASIDFVFCRGGGRHIGHKLRVGGSVGRYTRYSKVLTPYTETWANNKTAEWYAGKKGAQITKASHFDYEYVLGHKIVFLCVAKGKPRPTIVRYKDGRELFNHHYLHISQYWRGKHRIKSKMEIDPATQGDAGIYECHANNKYSIDMRSFRTDYNISSLPLLSPLATEQM